MESISVGQLHSEAYQVIKKNFGKILIAILVIIGVQFAYGLVAQVISMPLTMGSQLSLIPFYNSMDYMYGINNFGRFFGHFFAAFGPFYVIMVLLGLFIASAMEPLNAGRRLYMLDLTENKTVKVDQLFITFKKFWRFVACYLWVYLWTFLWSLLFIIPGIIKYLSYSMTPYLVAQYDDLTVPEAMDISKRITQGYKGEIFLMYLILFGWSLLSIFAFITLCFAPLVILAYGFLWLMPLFFTFEALMYKRIKAIAFQRGTLNADDLKVFVNQETQPEL